MRGDAGRALGLCALRRPLYFCDDLASLQVSSVAISPDGRRVVSGSDDHTLKVWENVAGQKQMFEVHVPQVLCLCDS